MGTRRYGREYKWNLSPIREGYVLSGRQNGNRRIKSYQPNKCSNFDCEYPAISVIGSKVRSVYLKAGGLRAARRTV